MSTFTHTVVAGDTLYSLAKRFDMTVEAIAKANNIKDVNLIKVGQKLIIPSEKDAEPGKVVTHTVVAGDTLYRIAKNLHSTVEAIQKANGLGESTLIKPGQVLRVPQA